MTTLKDLKKYKDEYCTKLLLSLADIVKNKCKIPSSKRMFIFNGWNGREYFLCDDKVYIVNFAFKRNEKLILTSLYVVTLKNEEVVNFETIIPDDTTPIFKEFYGTKIDKTKKLYTKEDFLVWYNSPCEINEFVDVSYKAAIDFLQNYSKTTFKTDRYLFYAKRDKDLSWCFFIYAKDLKTGADLKIYTPGGLEAYFPDNPRKVFIEDLSGELSKYQLRQCKKDFMEFCNQDCIELGVKNFWALDFVKQCIQPVEKDHGWFICWVFEGEFEFDNVWVDDFLGYDKKPYFLVSDKKRKLTKIAAIDFFEPKYKSIDIYKSGTFKRNHWDIDKETLEKLIEFLKAPYVYENTYFYKKHKEKGVEDDIKTNWQFLIQRYNDNTGDIRNESLPLDLPMPDYMEIINKPIDVIHPNYPLDSKKDWKGEQIISGSGLEKYFESLKDKIIGKTVDKIFYTGTLFNQHYDDIFEYKNGEWYKDGEKSEEPTYYPWKDSNTLLWLDSPVILDFEGTRLEIEYWSGSLVRVNTNSIDTEKFGADVSRHFARNIIGQKLVDIQIHKTDIVYFMNFEHLGIDRKDGDDMFEEIWFVFENGYKLELTTDHCDYTALSEVK